MIINPPGSPFGDRAAWTYNVKGDFEIRGVPSGSYVLTAWAETPAKLSSADRDYRAEMPLSVDNADVTGLKVTMDPYPRVAGHVIMERERPIALHNGAVRFGFDYPIRGARIDSDSTFASRSSRVTTWSRFPETKRRTVW